MGGWVVRVGYRAMTASGDSIRYGSIRSVWVRSAASRALFEPSLVEGDKMDGGAWGYDLRGDAARWRVRAHRDADCL